MAVMSIAEAWPAGARPFTVDDLGRMPEDGKRYELIDGVLTVSPAPVLAHQFALFELSSLLREACPEDLHPLPGPGVIVNVHTELCPPADPAGGATRVRCPACLRQLSRLC